MTDETREFIENFEGKIRRHNVDTLGGLFDKFTDLFTIYNRLYNESFAVLKNNNQLPNPKYSDFQRATSLPLHYLTSKAIIEKFTANGNQKDIDEACRLISNDVFNINLEEGLPRKDFDNQLLQNLQSASDDVKSQAVLSLIYNIRNNRIHGYKDFVEYQRLIMEPIINLLESIIELYKEKLR